MGFWQNLGEGALTKTVGGLIDSGFSALQSWQNFRYGEKAADAADRRQRAQFKDLYSLEAQMEQIKNAGLSPSMFFSGGLSGQGGASAPQGNGASGPMFNSSPIDMQAMAAAREMDSKTNLNNAQAELINEQTITQKWQNYITSSTAEVDIVKKTKELEALMAETEKIIAETEGQLIENELTEEKVEGQKLENTLTGEKITGQQLQNKLTDEQITSQKFQNEFNKDTRQYMFDKVKLDLVQTFMNTIGTQLDFGVKVAMYNKINAEVQHFINQDFIDLYNTKIRHMEASAQAKWFEDQAKVLYGRMNIDKYLASYKAREVATQEKNAETYETGTWLNFIATSLNACAKLIPF